MTFRWKQKKIEQLLATSLYETLDEHDRSKLERALAPNTALRDDYAALQRMVRAIPATPVERFPDLRPLLNSRLDSTPRRRAGYGIAFAAATALLAGSISLGVWYAGAPAATGPSAGYRSSEPDTIVARALVDAKSELGHQRVAAAYDTLRRALSHQTGDPQAGEAQWLVADCAFKLKRYAEAYDACNMLFAQYGASLEDHPGRREQAVNLRDLLAESKKVDFASLQAFDVAVRDRANTFAALEDVAANYAMYQGTGQYAFGDLVAKEMARTVAAEAGIDTRTPEGTLAAYQTAHDRCTSPIAVALLDMKIGDTYLGTLKDAASAKEHYERAAKNPVLASLASKALDRIKTVSQ